MIVVGVEKVDAVVVVGKEGAVVVAAVVRERKVVEVENRYEEVGA